MPRVVPVGRLSAVGAFVALALAGCAAGASPSPSSLAASPSAASSPAASASASAYASASTGASPSGSAEASSSASAGASGGSSAAPSGVADADITVTGVDYAFAGIPDAVDAGSVLGFRNQGSEVHEMVVFRINDDVEQTIQELLALPQDQSAELVTQTGFAIANPGEDAEETATVAEAGRYAMLCFIPIGTTSVPEGTPPPSGAPLPSGFGSGPPHFTVGMVKEFAVQ